MDTGLRHRQKQARRERIVAAALDLFTERGYDAVRIVDVAHAAEVSPGTVYNYFPTKEDLVLGGSGDFERALVDALASRPAHQPLVRAFREFTLHTRGALAQPDQAPVRAIARHARVIADSAALRLRVRRDFDRCTESVAELVAAERGPAVTPDQAWVIANAMIGVTRTMQRIVHRLAIADRPVAEIAAAVMAEGERALDQLEAGIGAG
ncbi:TetR/AcrR family transcriptional regulator [Glycomyces arizonensis]|uniref:TetR/AcrR family transcriptional regulator n=1 Tax=Glycomyces arizonensis TaxID=256035 RepID=UPI0003FA928E|nr:TetR/AcrR family transcriptional regulator [Glycomyces arizonensis]